TGGSGGFNDARAAWGVVLRAARIRGDAIQRSRLVLLGSRLPHRGLLVLPRGSRAGAPSELATSALRSTRKHPALPPWLRMAGTDHRQQLDSRRGSARGPWLPHLRRRFDDRSGRRALAGAGG